MKNDNSTLNTPKNISINTTDNSTMSASIAIESECLWNKTYTIMPSDLECVITYCDNPTLEPNTNGLNYNFTWSQELLLINDSFIYPCLDNYYHETNEEWRTNSPTFVEVVCDEQGELIYPSTWPQCSRTVSCPDPGNSPLVSRSYTTWTKNLEYGSVLRYTCDDKRKWIKYSYEEDSALDWKMDTRCYWNKFYSKNGTNLVCVMHHCRHPHDEPGFHEPPSAVYNLVLKQFSSWNVPFGNNIVYQCESGMFFENNEVDPTQNELKVQCINDVGEYNTPIRQGGQWPNCTQTVVCGQPPEPPVNGSRTWLQPAADLQETYDTTVRYYCQNGSQFDTNNDQIGDSIFIDIRCQWNKQWAPFSSLPPCLITHCVEPFPIPEESNLIEVTQEWTPINTYKNYDCKNKIDSVHTMFWETDRSKSTFELFCNPDGYFTWKDWPTCLTGEFRSSILN